MLKYVLLGPFQDRFASPAGGASRQPDHKGPVCPVMTSWLFIPWAVQNHCVQQMAEVTDFVHFSGDPVEPTRRMAFRDEDSNPVLSDGALIT